MYGNSTLSIEFTLLVEWSYGSSIYKGRTIALGSEPPLGGFPQDLLLIFPSPLPLPRRGAVSCEQGSSAPERKEASRSFSA